MTTCKGDKSMDYKNAWVKLREEIENSKSYMQTIEEIEIITIDKNILKKDFCEVVLKTMNKIEDELSDR